MGVTWSARRLTNFFAGSAPNADSARPDVPAHVRQRLAVQWRVRGGPDAADRWKSRAMLDRYGADMAQQRAIEAKRRMGDMY